MPYRPSRISRFVLLALAALALSPLAFADTFLATGSLGGVSGSANFTASPDGPGTFLLQSIDNPAVFGVLAPGTYLNNDNLLFPSSPQQLDANGFAFLASDGTGTYEVSIADLFGVDTINIFDPSSGDTITTPINFSLTANSAATPEPASFVLLGTGTLALFAVARRRIPVR